MNNPKKAFFGLLIALVVVVGASAAIFYFFDKQQVALSEEIGKLKAEQEVAHAQIKSFEKTKQKIEELNFVQSLAENVLPKEKEQANIVAELKGFVAAAGLSFEAISFTGPEGGTDALTSQTEEFKGLAGVRVLPVSVTISSGATYAQVLDLLQKIEQNQRKMQVSELILIPDNGGVTFSTISIGIDIYLSTR